MVQDHPRQAHDDLDLYSVESEKVNEHFNVASLTHHREYMLAILPASHSGIYNNYDEKTNTNGNNLVAINGSDIHDTGYEEESRIGCTYCLPLQM